MIHFNLTRDEFFARYFETRFHHQRGAMRDVDFGWKELNELLYLMDPGNRGIRLFQNGPVAEHTFVETYAELGVTRRRIIKEALYRIMSDGGTLVMNRLELVSSTIRQLCTSVSALCGAHAIANGYVAFAGKGSFGKHWDTHDVFAVQLMGRKRWVLYEPTFQLPTRHQTSRDVKEFCPPVPVFDEVLEKGDVLYIPRGWWHEALPLGEETCHVAIGTHGPTMADYAVWCCQKYLRDHLASRRALRLHDAQDNDFRALAQVLASVVENPITFEQFQREMVSDERMSTPFQLEHFIDPDRYPLSDEATLQINSALAVDVERQFLPTNGVAPPRNACERVVLNRLAGSAGSSIGGLVDALPDQSAEAVRAAVRALLKGNHASIQG